VSPTRFVSREDAKGKRRGAVLGIRTGVPGSAFANVGRGVSAAATGAEEPEQYQDDCHDREDGFKPGQEPEDDSENEQSFGAQKGPGRRTCTGREAGPECGKDDADAQAGGRPDG